MDALAPAVAAAAVVAVQDAPGSARVLAPEDAVMPASRRAPTAQLPVAVPVIKDVQVDAVGNVHPVVGVVTVNVLKRVLVTALADAVPLAAAVQQHVLADVPIPAAGNVIPAVGAV